MLVLGGLGVSINGGPRTLADSTRLDSTLPSMLQRTMYTEARARRIDPIVGVAFVEGLLLATG